jgi:hypothetical protein
VGVSKAPAPVQPAAVHGLEAGRKHAQRALRRRRRRNRITTLVIAAIAAGVIAGAGWVAFEIYAEHTTDEQLEHERRVAELERRRDGQDVEDVIGELEELPRWNGPGTPAFGVGDEQP